MRQQIVRLSVHQTAKVLAVLYAIMGLIFIPFVAMAWLVAPEGERLGLGFMLLFPVIYGIFGYLFVALGCALYNLVAKGVGGIEFTVRTDDPAAATPL